MFENAPVDGHHLVNFSEARGDAMILGGGHVGDARRREILPHLVDGGQSENDVAHGLPLDEKDVRVVLHARRNVGNRTALAVICKQPPDTA